MPITLRISEPIPTPEVIESEEILEVNLGNLFNCDLKPKEIASAVLHAFSARLEGEYLTDLINTGKMRLWNLRMSHSLLQVDQNVSLFQGITKSLRRGIPRGGSFSFRTKWEVTGVLDVLWALIQIFFTGTARVKETAKVSAFGFSKTLIKDVRVPVKSVSVAWD